MNFTLEIVYILFSMIGTLIAIITMSIQIAKGLRYAYFLLLLHVWIIYFIVLLTWVVALLYVDIGLIKWVIGLYVLLGFVMLLSSDVISHEAIDPIKLIIYLFLSSLAIYESVQSNVAVIITLDSGVKSITMTSSAFIVQIPFFLFYNLTYLYTLGKMVINAPLKLKVYTKIAFWGFMILVLPGLGFMYINPYVDYKLSGIQFIFVAIGILMLNYTIIQNPKMIFILPFKALRLTVLQSNSGIALFDYKWEQKKPHLDEILYTSMLQGVNLIIKESLDRGQVEEIHTSKAIILAHHNANFPITCILVAVKASKTLREALQKFAEKFELHYEKYLNMSDISKFSSAVDLINQYFPFIPPN